MTLGMMLSVSVVYRSCKCRNEQTGLVEIVQDVNDFFSPFSLFDR